MRAHLGGDIVDAEPSGGRVPDHARDERAQAFCLRRLHVKVKIAPERIGNSLERNERPAVLRDLCSREFCAAQVVSKKFLFWNQQQQQDQRRDAGDCIHSRAGTVARARLQENRNVYAAYVKSEARGDLNDFNSYFGNFENPIIRPNERSRLPWDAPNRFLFWGEFHAKYGITVTPVFDIRTGFPYSIIDAERNFVGPRNRAGRFPTFASLDLQVMKSVSLPGRWKKYRAELGLKVFNVTNHFNPRDFQNNLASDDFGGFSNGVGRKFGTRITFIKK